MKYTLIYTQRAERDITGLDSRSKERIGKTLLRYKEDPYKKIKVCKKMTGTKQNDQI